MGFVLCLCYVVCRPGQSVIICCGAHTRVATPLPLPVACAASSHATLPPHPPLHPRDYDMIISLAAATDSILCRSFTLNGARVTWWFISLSAVSRLDLISCCSETASINTSPLCPYPLHPSLYAHFKPGSVMMERYINKIRTHTFFTDSASWRTIVDVKLSLSLKRCTECSDAMYRWRCAIMAWWSVSLTTASLYNSIRLFMIIVCPCLIRPGSFFLLTRFLPLFRSTCVICPISRPRRVPRAFLAPWSHLLPARAWHRRVALQWIVFQPFSLSLSVGLSVSVCLSLFLLVQSC